MTKNFGARSEHRDGCDRVTKNVGDVGARSEQGRNIVTVTKNVGAGSEKLEQCDSIKTLFRKCWLSSIKILRSLQSTIEFLFFKTEVLGGSGMHSKQ